MTLQQISEALLAQVSSQASQQERINELAQACLQRALERSSGQVSLEFLAEVLKHPYGHGDHDYRGRPREGIPYGDLAMINAHSGDFKAGWRIELTQSGFVLYNRSEIAAWLEEGTVRMMARPILNAIIEEVIVPYGHRHGVKYTVEIHTQHGHAYSSNT